MKNLNLITKIKKLTSKERIGPHNIDIISMIIGSTLGDTHLEKRKNGIGTRVIFEQSNNNIEYLMWFHAYLSSRGYCNSTKPNLQIRIKQKGKIFYKYRVNSFTFSSFNWIYDMFYKLVDKKYIKFVPLNIEEYLTPLALAIWFMDDGSRLGKSVIISTNCFTFEEMNFLCKILESKYNIIATPNKCGKNKGHIIYIHVNSIKLFYNIIKPYLLPSLYYKLGSYK
jgi:ubiquinol-cytochrome c reductase cytochrome b subunit